MAPEQWAGGVIAPSADIYALGVIAYEILTGRRPFPVLEELAAASSVNPQLSPAVDQLLSRMLAKNPLERPPAAGAAIASLRRALLEQAPRLDAAWLRAAAKATPEPRPVPPPVVEDARLQAETLRDPAADVDVLPPSSPRGQRRGFLPILIASVLGGILFGLLFVAKRRVEAPPPLVSKTPPPSLSAGALPAIASAPTLVAAAPAAVVSVEAPATVVSVEAPAAMPAPVLQKPSEPRVVAPASVAQSRSGVAVAPKVSTASPKRKPRAAESELEF
jgi:serine/threonine-protein kinase